MHPSPLPGAERLSALSLRPACDPWTAALVLLMVGGFPVLVWATHAAWVPLWAGALLGTLLMNLSFTAWHEPAHGNFSRWRWLNTTVGMVASQASVFPGYFARRREHLIHHRYEGQPGKDPVYPRLQETSAWGFPWRVARVALKGEPWDVPADYLALSPRQRLADALNDLASLGLLGVSVWAGFWPALLAVWIVPRFVVLVLHAYYICWFPHAVPGGGFQTLRVRRAGLVLRFLTVDQTLHGIHHCWPAIPWHRYGRVLRDFPEEVARAGIEVR